ncbi:recombinase family protein [Bradyrhizobium jicamae]|uniref:recombinase family protein n=1 Tax=Bradyrhizobium jicamae TaxID=280332 RepID=UPI001BAB9B4C|nr:recombinase family protein [Bradyrhizobium jicamae]MBR0934322.1 recombinase family protein [Bradyrhizobium jicamae]
MLRAAQYVRMSSNPQQYSIEIQAAAIAAYAARRGIEIVRNYSDPGRSGLTIARPQGLQQLINDVESGQPGFDCVLVFDASRWGRFQDTDESAYYEFICKRAGIQVHYCADEFENDGSLSSVMLKSLKRAKVARSVSDGDVRARRWEVRKLKYQKAALTLLIRMDHGNNCIQDYFLLPTAALPLTKDRKKLRVSDHLFGRMRLDSLEAVMAALYGRLRVSREQSTITRAHPPSIQNKTATSRASHTKSLTPAREKKRSQEGSVAHGID